jgi:hypothetical protein
LKGVQDWVVAQQVNENLERQRVCKHCGRRHSTKDAGSAPVKTVFGRGSRCQIHAGTGAPVRPRAQRHSGPRKRGCRGEPVRNCFTWRRSGLRWSLSPKWQTC